LQREVGASLVYDRPMPRVGFLGAYSIDNTGDVIVGLATRQAVRTRVACDEVVLAVDLPHALWRHDWQGIQRVDPTDEAGRFADDLDALVVGGGGILIPLPGFGPFLARVRAPAAWNAVCSQGTPWFDPELAPFYAAVRAACEGLAYASVRNATTARLVRHCGWTGPLEIVPDPALLYRGEPDPAVDRELARRGGRPLVGFSPGNALTDPRAQRFYAELLAELDRRAAAGEIELVVFPFGRIYGDVELARRAAAAMPHARLVGLELTPTATWQLVGKLDLCVCARLHAALAAYAHGVAFLVCDEYLSDATASSKIRDFIVDRELEPSYVVPALGTHPAARLQLALADRHRAAATTALAADRAALERHFDRLVAALGLTAS
jgi:hypothetical protein